MAKPALDPSDPSRLSPAQRRSEIARILAIGLTRPAPSTSQQAPELSQLPLEVCADSRPDRSRG